MLSRLRPKRAGSRDTSEHNGTKASSDIEREPALATQNGEDGPVRLVSPRVFAMGLIVSIGGFIFGYDTGNLKSAHDVVTLFSSFQVKYLAFWK